jgi:hypothetical protein
MLHITDQTTSPKTVILQDKNFLGSSVAQVAALRMPQCGNAADRCYSDYEESSTICHFNYRYKQSAKRESFSAA